MVKADLGSSTGLTLCTKCDAISLVLTDKSISPLFTLPGVFQEIKASFSFLNFILPFLPRKK